MKKFEIPYNFDPNLITCLKSLNIDENLIHCIYTCPVSIDYSAATRAPHTVQQLAQIDKEQYSEHMKMIEEAFPGRLQLLLQSNERVLSKEELQFYLDLHFTKFCVGNYEQALVIKSINPEFEVFGSITMKVQPDDLQHHPEWEGVFDGFVLFYNYARDFELIQSLPKKYQYILLVNCFCHLSCPGTHHWFMSPLEYLLRGGNVECPNTKYLANGLPVPWEESCLIRPQDLSLFNPYISVYKLQGREFPTGQIIQHFMQYLGENANSFFMFDGKMDPDITLYLKPKE